MATNIEAKAIAGGHFGGTTLMQSRIGIGGLLEGALTYTQLLW